MSSSIQRSPSPIVRQGSGIERGKKTITRGKIERDGFRELLERDDFDIDMPIDGGNLQDDSDAQMNEIGRVIRENRKRSEQDYAIMNDERFYFCMVFQTEEQKLEFLRRVGWLDTMEYNNFENMYINGLEVARRMQIPIDAIEMPEIDLRGNPNIYRKEVIINGRPK